MSANKPLGNGWCRHGRIATPFAFALRAAVPTTFLVITALLSACSREPANTSVSPTPAPSPRPDRAASPANQTADASRTAGCNELLSVCGKWHGKTVTIDARTGQTVGRGPTGLGRASQLRVLVVNTNPFRYRYQLLITERGLPSQDLDLSQLFFKNAALATTRADSEHKAAATTPVAGEAKAPSPDSLKKKVQGVGPNACDAAIASAIALDTALAAATRHVEVDASAYAAFARADSVLRGGLMDPGADAGALLHVADSAAKIEIAEANRLRLRLDVLRAAGSRLDSLGHTAATLLAVAGSQTSCTIPPGILAALAADTARARAAARFVTDTAVIAAGELPARAQRITEIAHAANAYWHVATLGPYDSATAVSVTLVCGDSLGQHPSLDTLAHRSFRFGSPRAFALALGPGFANFPVVTFARQQTVRRDANGAATDSTVTIVGEADSSKWLIPPLLMLHLRLWEVDQIATSFHVSLGTSLAQDVRGSARMWLTGLSFGLNDERAFITVGELFGPTRELAGGLKVNDRVPASLAELPITTRTTGRLAFAFTVRSAF